MKVPSPRQLKRCEKRLDCFLALRRCGLGHCDSCGNGCCNDLDEFSPVLLKPILERFGQGIFHAVYNLLVAYHGREPFKKIVGLLMFEFSLKIASCVRRNSQTGEFIAGRKPRQVVFHVCQGCRGCVRFDQHPAIDLAHAH